MFTEIPHYLLRDSRAAIDCLASCRNIVHQWTLYCSLVEYNFFFFFFHFCTGFPTSLLFFKSTF